MTFDPDHEPQTNLDWNHYMTWCAQRYNELANNDEMPRTFGTAHSALSLIHVVAVGILSLDDVVTEPERDSLERQLVRSIMFARAIERRRPIEKLRLLSGRGALDCWIPSARYAEHALTAARCALSGLILIEYHPLEDLWDLDAPDCWGLALLAGVELGELPHTPLAGTLAVRPNKAVWDRMKLQHVNTNLEKAGLPKFNPN